MSTSRWLVVCLLSTLLGGCSEASDEAVDGGARADAARVDGGPALLDDASTTPLDDGGAEGIDGSTAIDGSVAIDAGAPDGGPTTPGDHESFIPAGLRPTEAARLIVMGDSISAGVGASRAGLRYGTLLATNDDTRWATEMASDLSSRFARDVAVVNVAVGGSTTSALAGSQLATLRTRLGATVSGHSIVVLTSGGNDVTGALRAGRDPTGATLDGAIENLGDMVAFFRDTTRFPDGVSIYVAAVYDPTDGVGRASACLSGVSVPMIPAWLDTWREAYVEAGMDLGIAIVDALGHFQGHGFHHDDPANPYYDAADPALWFDDCVHPNDEGHNELRRLFFEAIDGTYRAD